MKKLFIVVNVDYFFLSHRKEVGIVASKKYDVTIVAQDTGRRKDIEDLGLKFIDLPLDRSGMNLGNEMKTFKFLYTLYKREKPDLVHHVGLKVILWGTLAAKLTKINSVVNAISGLGVFFSADNKSMIGKLLPFVLKFAHSKLNVSCIFQNDEDRELFILNKIIKENQADFIKGSGVDLNIFTYTEEPDSGKIKVLFTARMLKEKGVLILAEAAKLIKDRYYDKVEFLLCGALDDNPTALKQEDIDNICDGKYIQWLGFRTDVLDLLKNCHIVAFPSYYKEGLPKSLIEATAIGRPIITTDSIGCRETVEHEVNGFLIPIKNSEILAQKLSLLIDSKVLRVKMGKESRLLAEKHFSLNKVIEQHLTIYERLLK